MGLSQDDLSAIKGIIEEVVNPVRTDIKELSDKMDKVLKFVAIDNADFDPERKNGKSGQFYVNKEEA